MEGNKDCEGGRNLSRHHVWPYFCQDGDILGNCPNLVQLLTNPILAETGRDRKLGLDQFAESVS